MKSIVITIINIYSSFLSLDRGILSLLVPGGACRYSPTCSQYTKDVVYKHGIVKGIYLGIRRLLSCR